MNERLYDLYQGHWNSLAEALRPHNPVQRGLSNPLLIDLSLEYERAQPKLVIVGQQTKGWGSFGEGYGNDPVADLMAAYTDFQLGRFYRPTPFWQAAYVVHMSTDQCTASFKPFSFGWTNLVKIDERTLRPSVEIEQLVSERFPVVREELEIARPDIVVFFTGPDYDGRLEGTFPGLRRHPAADVPEVERISHKSLPYRSFRRYHPGHMARRRDNIYERVMRKLIELCNAEL